MNKDVIDFIDEMRNLTNESFWITVEHIAYGFKNEIKTTYRLLSTLNGFNVIEKETEQELIQVLPLVKRKVFTLMEAKKIQERINVKLLNSENSDE